MDREDYIEIVCDLPTAERVEYDKPAKIEFFDFEKNDKRRGNCFKWSTANIGARNPISPGGQYHQQYGFTVCKSIDCKGMGERIYQRLYKSLGSELLEFVYVSKFQAAGHFSIDGCLSLSAVTKCSDIRANIDDIIRDESGRIFGGSGDCSFWGTSKRADEFLTQVVPIQHRMKILKNLMIHSDNVYTMCTFSGPKGSIAIASDVSLQMKENNDKWKLQLKRGREIENVLRPNADDGSVRVNERGSLRVMNEGVIRESPLKKRAKKQT